MSNLRIGQRILRWFSRDAEDARMEMRHARCYTEAVAEDLNRTVVLNRDKLTDALRKKRMNGKDSK